jgi:flagellar motor switch protein FliM
MPAITNPPCLTELLEQSERTDLTGLTERAWLEGPAEFPVPAPNSGSLPKTTPFKNAALSGKPRPPLLTPRQLRQWQNHHEGFAGGLASKLSLFLRSELRLVVAGSQLLSYQRMTESWREAAHMTLFKTEPLRGISILRIPAPLGMAIVDLLMGGSGRPGAARPEMGEIENALLEQTAQVVAAEWCDQAAPLLELKPVLLGHESNARFLQTAPPQSDMLVVGLDATLCDCREQIQMAFPCAALEPLLRKLAAQRGVASEPAPPPANACGWKPCFDEVRIPVTGAWQGWEVPARDVLRLKVGDVLRMDSAAAGQVEVRLGGQAKFQGRPGLVAGNWAVELTEVVKH